MAAGAASNMAPATNIPESRCLFRIGKSPVLVVLIAIILFDFLVGNPVQVPGAGPGTRVSVRAIRSDLVMKGIEIGPRDALGDPERLGVGQAAARHPEAFVEGAGADHERVTFPVAGGIAVGSG